MPNDYLDWKIVKETGWTLEYVRSLPWQDVLNYLQINDAQGKAKR